MYEEEKEEEKEYLEAFPKEDLNEGLVNTAVIENHSRGARRKGYQGESIDPRKGYLSCLNRDQE